ncbi:unnamed protein product [Closterium sp. Yama58-4]|nr:unnamed protein product [Closterium sp. Yama58-4]
MATVAHLASLVPYSHRTITAARNAIACLLVVHTVIAVLFFNLLPLPFATPLLRPTIDLTADDLVFLPSRYDIGESNSSDFTEGGSVPREVEEESGGSAFPEAQAVDGFKDPQRFSLEELARREVLTTARSDMLRRIDDELRHDDSGKTCSQKVAFLAWADGKCATLVRGSTSIARETDPLMANETRSVAVAPVDLPAKREFLLEVRAAIAAITNLNQSELDALQMKLLDFEKQQKERESNSFYDAWRLANPQVTWPPQNSLSSGLAERNKLPPRIPQKTSWDVRRHLRRSDDSAANERRAEDAQAWSKARLGDDQIVMVLLVHNRPAYLRRTLAAMRRVEGIQDVLLIVSHDGYYPKMDAMVRAVDFCPVKQIYFPFSPHLFNGTFPAASPDDCQGRLPKSEAEWEGEEGEEGDGGENGGRGGEGPEEEKDWVGNCSGQVDRFGRFRNPRTISLKHHWWWAMNTVWGGLAETRGFKGHVVWVEEDHQLFPNALRHLRALLHAKHARCPDCIAANLAPSDVHEWQDSGPRTFSVETMGNIGYCFNRTVWDLIHKQAEAFCYFDDYNWDVTMSGSVLKRLPNASSIRWSRTSARHFGNCGFHSGRGRKTSNCVKNIWWNHNDDGIELAESDDVAIADGTWLVSSRREPLEILNQELLRSGFAALNAAYRGGSTIRAATEDRTYADLEMEEKLKFMRDEVEKMDLKAEESYDRAGARLLDLFNGRKEREAQSFFDTWRRMNPYEPWPPSSPLSRRLEEWNRRPVRAPVTAGNAEKTGGGMGLLAKLRAQVRRRAGGKRSSSSAAITSSSSDSISNLTRSRGPWKKRLSESDVVMVLLVHNRPAYLRRTLEALSKVEGIQDTLLIVSHDGYYPEMHALVRGITFCAVKQLYFPLSPHLFNGAFPAASPADCQGSAHDATGGGECTGQADQYGSFRDPRRLSLKHHWWWAMNTVWGGLAETQGYGGHVVWVEEDHLLFPNALRHLRALLHAKHARCPHCIAANLAPSDVGSIQDDERGVFSAERMGNVGYAFNRSVWELIHAQAKPFCLYEDYNWDLTLWSSVLRRLPSSWSLRWSRASAHHVGSCGLHSGQGDSQGKSNTSSAAAVKGSGVEGREKDAEEGKEKKSVGCSIGEDGIEKVQLIDEDYWMMVNASAPVVEREEEKRWTMFPGWVCLDGSAPGFYYRRGHGSGANKWLLNFRSGAWCTSPWDCYNRSSSLWGSSNHFPDVLPTPGILSAQRDVNPDLCDWNLVIFPYCDGASFSGDRQDPLVFEGVPLFSRGRRILDFLLAHLTARFHMATAQRVLISGCSAGALVVYLHCDYIRHAHMPPSASVQCLADSGLFLDITAAAPPENTHVHHQQQLRPLLRHALAPPEADPSGELIASCLRKLHTCNQSQLATLQGVRDTVTATVAPLLSPTAAGGGGERLGVQQQQHGVFLFSCLTHCTSHYEDHWLRLTVNNQTLMHAVGQWLRAVDSATDAQSTSSTQGGTEGFEAALIDCPYPCNSCNVQAPPHMPPAAQKQVEAGQGREGFGQGQGAVAQRQASQGQASQGQVNAGAAQGQVKTEAPRAQVGAEAGQVQVKTEVVQQGGGVQIGTGQAGLVQPEAGGVQTTV